MNRWNFSKIIKQSLLIAGKRIAGKRNARRKPSAKRFIAAHTVIL